MWFLEPGVRLLDRLSFGRKFLLIGFVFALALLGLLWTMLQGAQARISTAELEREGVAYVAGLDRLFF